MIWPVLQLPPVTLVIVGSTSIAKAATVPPASWSIEVPPVKSFDVGTKFHLVLRARIGGGWHIYALDEPEGGPIPTQIGLAQNDALTLLDVQQPKPQAAFDPILRQPLGMFEKDVAFTLTLRVTRPPSAVESLGKVVVRYQSCNDKVCLPPRSETIPFLLKGLVR